MNAVKPYMSYKLSFISLKAELTLDVMLNIVERRASEEAAAFALVVVGLTAELTLDSMLGIFKRGAFIETCFSQISFETIYFWSLLGLISIH